MSERGLYMKVKDLIRELEKLPEDLDVIISNDFTSKRVVDFQKPTYANCKQGRACYWKDGVLRPRDCVLIVTK